MSFANLRYPMNPLGNQRLKMGCNLNEKNDVSLPSLSLQTIKVTNAV